MARCESCGGDPTDVPTADTRLVTDEEAGRIINPDAPLSRAAARKRLNRAGIRSQHGYPIERVRELSRIREDKQ